LLQQVQNGREAHKGQRRPHLHAARSKHLVQAALIHERDKPKAAWPLVVVIIHDHRVLNRAVLLKVAAQRLFIDTWRKATHKHLAAASCCMLILTPTTTATASAALCATTGWPAVACCAAWRWLLLRHRFLALHLHACHHGGGGA
jgi:hypothetical protein